MILWMAGAGLSLVQMLAGWAAITGLKRHAIRLHDTDFTQLAELLHVSGKVELLESEAGSMPMTFGFFRAVLFMPADAAGMDG